MDSDEILRRDGAQQRGIDWILVVIRILLSILHHFSDFFTISR